MYEIEQTEMDGWIDRDRERERGWDGCVCMGCVGGVCVGVSQGAGLSNSHRSDPPNGLVLIQSWVPKFLKKS